MLAVTASARVSAAPPKEEDTLSRGLGTPPLPEAHSPVGYCWQNSRCCRPLRGPQHSHIGDFVSHPNDQARGAGPPRETSMIPGDAEAGRVRCSVWLGVGLARPGAMRPDLNDLLECRRSAAGLHAELGRDEAVP